MYGQFIERRGRCIYGGVYESRSPLADELYAHAVNAHASSHARRRVDVQARADPDMSVWEINSASTHDRELPSRTRTKRR